MQMLLSAAVVFLPASQSYHVLQVIKVTAQRKLLIQNVCGEGHCNMDIGHKFLCQIYQTRLEANTFRTFEFTNCSS